MTAKGTVFIITYGRSGSTLLQTVLNNFPGVCIRGENYLSMIPLYESWWRATSTKKDFGGKLSGDNEPWFGADVVSPDSYGKALADAFLTHVLVPPAEAEWIGCKEIRYNAVGNRLEKVIDFIFDFFPNPKIIFNIRNAEAVSHSGWFANRDKTGTLEMVATMNARFAQEVAKRPNSTALVHYEDLLMTPEHLRPALDLLGLEFNRETIESVIDVKLEH